jgi:hypothetical protein
MEEVINRSFYRPDVVTEIEAMGAMVVSIANRWMLGWPDRVKALLIGGTYLEYLKSQAEQEGTMLVNEANLRHLSRREILEMYEIREAPPPFGE